MLKTASVLMIMLLGIPAAAIAGSPYESVHARHTEAFTAAQYERARHYDGRQADERITRMQIEQRKRIRQGVRSGALTRHEAGHLMSEQQRIAALERRYKADGHFSRRERAHVERLLNRAGQHIYNAKHDAQSRNRRSV
jgi:hypothetical protein